MIQFILTRSVATLAITTVSQLLSELNKDDNYDLIDGQFHIETLH